MNARRLAPALAFLAGTALLWPCFYLVAFPLVAHTADLQTVNQAADYPCLLPGGQVRRPRGLRPVHEIPRWSTA